MKWLYRILRLFACPHRWTRTGQIALYDEQFRPGENPIGHKLIYTCVRCGKTRVLKT